MFRSEGTQTALLIAGYRGSVGLPRQQPERAALACVVYLVLVGLSATGLVLLRGLLLGGFLALVLAALLTVPLVVLGHLHDEG